MADSTQPTELTRPSAPPARGGKDAPLHVPPGTRPRWDIVQLAEAETEELTELLVEQAPTAPTGRKHDDRALADIIRETVGAISVAGATGVLPDPADRRLFRLLGARCGAAGFTVEEVTGEVRLCGARMGTLLLDKSSDLDGLYDVPTIAETLSVLCDAAIAVTRTIENEILPGYAAAIAWQAPDPRTVQALCEALDESAHDDALPPGARTLDDLSSVAVLCATGCQAQRRLELAGHDAEVLIPTAIDAGTAQRPLHRRIVFAGSSPQMWREASATLQAIGQRYNLLVRTTIPAPGLRRLGDAYRLLAEGLPRNVAPATRPGLTTAAATA